MSILTFLLDGSIINAFEFYNTMDKDKEGEPIPLPKFKRSIAEALVASILERQDSSKDIGEVVSLNHPEE